MHMLYKVSRFVLINHAHMKELYINDKMHVFPVL
jgi:hypothetical protein